MRRAYFLPLLLLLFLLEAPTSPGRRTTAVAGGDSLKGQRRGTPDSAAALTGLQRDLASILGSMPSGTRAAILVRSLRTGRVIYSSNPDLPLTPASTTKVVTCFTALSELGAGYVVKTTLESEAKPRTGGLPRNLYVKGYGDPSLTVSKLDDLCDQFLRLGVRRVDGDVVGDGTFFDAVNTRFLYSGDRDDPEGVAPIDALTLESRSYNIVVSSTSVAGSTCNVQTWPHSTAFTIVNSATVGSAAAPRKGRRADLAPVQGDRRQRYGDAGERVPMLHQRQPKMAAGGDASTRNTPPANKGTTQVKKNGIRIDVSPAGADGRITITVSGTLAPNKTVSVRQPLKNAPLVIAGAIMNRLQREGVEMNGRLLSGAAPPGRRILAETGRPLVDILRSVMKQSNNFLAEYTFRIIGAANGGQERTAAHAVAAVQERMTRCNVPFGNCAINDGSGLSRRNLLSPSALVGIMSYAYSDRKFGPTFRSLLAVAGVDGTLRGRMKGTPAAGNLLGKTGTLNSVSTLSGYVTTRDGEPLAFAFMMNGPGGGGYRAWQDRLGVRLASFSYSAPVSTPEVKAVVSPPVAKKK